MEVKYVGWIKLIFGPMFSEKTSNLIAEVEKFKIAKNKKCIIIKHIIDNRYNEHIKNGGVMSHSLREYSLIPVITCDKLENINVAEYDVIGIDEGQFFQDIVDFCWTNVKLGKNIIVAALNSDFNQQPWKNISQLMPYCRYIKRKHAVCMKCDDDHASFSILYNRVNSDTNIVVGGKDKFISVCEKCLLIS